MNFVPVHGILLASYFPMRTETPLLNAAYSLSPFWQFLFLGALILLLCHYIVIYRERRILRSSCTNMTALLGISELDYFILDSYGNYVLRPRNDRCWKFVHGKPVSPDEWIIPEDVAEYKAKLAQLLEGKSFYLSMIYRVSAPEGRRYFSMRAMPVISANRRGCCFVGTVHEITSARRNEQQYHDTMILLQNIMDSIPCPIFTKDIDDNLRYLTSNKIFGDQLGLSVSRLVGKTDFDIFRKEDEAQVIRAHDEVIVAAGGRLFDLHENYTTRENQMYFCHSLKKVLTLSNGKRVLLGISVDTTREELAKQQLAESEKKLREANILMQSILDNAPCSIWLKERESGKYLLANEGFYRFLHTNPSAVIGKRMEDFMPAARVEELRRSEETIPDIPGEIFSFDRDYELNGKHYYAHVLELLMTGENGKNLLLGISIDITRLIETQQELKVALDKAQAANRARNYFFASVSHELRTPLNAVIGFSELMQNQNQTEKERIENLKAINYAGNTLLNLINDVLDLSKLEAEQMPIVPASVNLSKICREILVSFKPRCVERNISMNFEIPDFFPDSMLLDDLRLRQIFFNLVGNAVKFTHDGQIRITLGFTPNPDERKGILDITVSDTGSGIPFSDQKKIFEPFMQSMHHIPGNQSYQGTGLGLPIVKKMVECMHGSISLQSAPGKGSLFFIRIPDVELGRKIDEEKSLCKSGVKMEKVENFILETAFRKIMLVDDVPMNLKVLEAMLRRLGFQEISICSSGEEVLNKIGDFRPDVLFADLWMPQMKGDELARKLSENPETAAIPVIVITADTQLAPDNCFRGMLLKPVTLMKLMEVFQGIQA